MFNCSVRCPNTKTVGSFIAGAALSLGTLFASSLPARAESRQLYEYEYKVVHTDYVERVVRRRSIRATPSQAFQELRRCFNCSFPVSGAPRAYPKDDQFIPLRACAGGKFGCKDAPVKAYSFFSLDRIVLVAESGHFDGKDSTIIFNFITDSSGNLKIKVTAFVTDPTVPDFLNKTFARTTWRSFARKLGENMWNNTCAKGKVCGN